jgi:NADP-dependent 3-hydroxy acid dehydrogenase YdfG
MLRFFNYGIVMNNKIFLLTGAYSGLEEASSAILAQAGYHIIML